MALSFLPAGSFATVVVVLFCELGTLSGSELVRMPLSALSVVPFDPTDALDLMEEDR